MLFWGSIILIVVGIIFAIIESYYESHYDRWGSEILCDCAIGFVIIGAIIFLISATVLGFAHIDRKATLQSNIEIYKALTYKAESGACRDQFGLLSKDVLDDIQEWNTKIAHYKAMEDNFWLGIFYPDVYGDLGMIDYELYK